MKFKNIEWEEVRVMSEEKVDEIPSDEPTVSPTPEEQSAPLPSPKEESDFLKNFHDTTTAPTVGEQSPLLMQRPRRSFGILKILVLIFLAVFIAIAGILAAWVRKMYYLIEPHLASEALPIPEIAYNEATARAAQEKVDTVLYGTGTWTGRVASLTATELNQLLASYQTLSERATNKMFVTFPQDGHLRFHRSRKVPPLFPTSLQNKRRLNTIIEIEPTINKNTASATIHTLYVGSNDITNSLQSQNMRLFSFPLSHRAISSTVWELPLKMLAIKNNRLYLAN